jgi:hypothetical protein
MASICSEERRRVTSRRPILVALVKDFCHVVALWI